MNDKKKVDVLTGKSEHGGLKGLFESFLRTFRDISYSLMLMPITLLCCFAMGISLVPAIYLFGWVKVVTNDWNQFFHIAALGCSISIGYVLYGITLVFVIPAINFVLPLRLKAWRGISHSIYTIPWFYHNGLTYIVRYTFLDMITPTPLNILFYKMMGMKIGKGTIINTTNISDPCMITLGDHVTIGGSATLCAHYGQKGFLIIEPLIIKDKANIGLKSSIMGDVIIGEKANVRPHQVVLPKSRIADGETV